MGGRVDIFSQRKDFIVFILKQRPSPPPVPGQVGGSTAGGVIAKGSAPIQLLQVLDPAVDQH